VTGSVILVPVIDPANALNITGWLCGPSVTSIAKYLPGSCRDTTVANQNGFATNVP
jgi:type IV pilus assembly protein PilA